ncbi:ACT domain-containing protein [Alteromonas sp. 1_MG-2023]|uniref:ACT domain-containing protein n=1 Tax=Alteromonas sp. 1_MG-2023 TaxID=3062669 RepID=UPI0026E14668|nr:ACT domain-containing protein [Alteromonas sp. 1_MG-2023]MDO6569158.1 ACT domain-containing protein [Alteromonas sp. 1_MG-2023]
MSGETDLGKLLQTLQPVLSAEEFVFVSVPYSVSSTQLANALMVFKEEEGTTLILESSFASNEGFEVDSTYKRITCNVHSSLDAVGMTAAMSAALTNANISANVVAGYYHDHIFVPQARADEAIAVLLGLASR